ncbi:MAG: peptidoglycan editing factor PgeF [Mycoplasmatales bacterium]
MNKDFSLNYNNLFIIEDWKQDNIHAFFSTKLDGVSKGEYDGLNLALHVGDNKKDVLDNRIIYADKINKNLNRFVYGNQTHSDHVYNVTSKDLGKGVASTLDAIEDVDAFYTFENNIVLNCFYADCTPVFFKSTKHNLIGVIHAGWQGSIKEITYKTLKHIMNTYNIKPTDLSIFIGPSIDVANFEVQIDVIDKLNNCSLNYVDCYHVKDSKKYNLDVKKMNKKQASALGISNIYVSNIDTYSNKILYSFRKKNITGRMCASIYQENN